MGKAMIKINVSKLPKVGFGTPKTASDLDRQQFEKELAVKRLNEASIQEAEEAYEESEEEESLEA